MTYYLTFKNDDQYIEIGTESFKNFWVEKGFEILTKVINDSPEALSEMIIKDEQGLVISITEFLDIIGKLNIIV